jgi:O-antigen/teichoic acid export membrane protein
MEHYQKFTKNIWLVAGTNMAIATKNIVILPIITKMLGIENFGVWVQITLAFYIIVPLINLGLPFALVRFLPAEKNKKEMQNSIYSVLTINFLGSLLASFLLIFFSNPLSNFIGCTQNVIYILSLIVIFECLNVVFLNIFRALKKIKRYSLFIIVQSIGEILFIVCAIALGYGLFGAIMALLVIRLAIFAFCLCVILKEVGLSSPNFSGIKAFLRFSMPTIPSNVSYLITNSSDKYIINYFSGLVSAGYYATSYTLGGIISFLEAPFSFLLPAVLSKSHDENRPQELKIYLGYSLKYFLMLAIPSFFGLWALAKPILTIFSNNEVAEHSYYVVPIIALSFLFLGIYSIFSQILSVYKKTNIIGTVWLISAVINISTNFILIPMFGILGAAISTLIAFAYILISALFYSSKYLTIKLNFIFVLKSILASLAMTAVVLFINPTGLFKTLVSVLLGIFIYGLFLLLIKGLTKKEINFFLLLLRLKKTN